MKKIGIVLLVLQVLTIAGGLSNGQFSLAVNGAADVIKLIGYFTPAIIGTILLVKAGKKEAVSKGAATSCPECGAAVEAGDDFCMHCGSAIKKQ